jgi:hypothetical protein
MNEVRLPIETVEKVLQYLAKGTTGETGQLFFSIQQLSQTQLKEFNDKQLEETIKARVKADSKPKKAIT